MEESSVEGGVGSYRGNRESPFPLAEISRLFCKWKNWTQHLNLLKIGYKFRSFNICYNPGYIKRHSLYSPKIDTPV